VFKYHSYIYKMWNYGLSIIVNKFNLFYKNYHCYSFVIIYNNENKLVDMKKRIQLIWNSFRSTSNKLEMEKILSINYFIFYIQNILANDLNFKSNATINGYFVKMSIFLCHYLVKAIYVQRRRLMWEVACGRGMC